MEGIIKQIDNAFLEIKATQLQQRDEIIAEQKMLRNRWRGNQ